MIRDALWVSSLLLISACATGRSLDRAASEPGPVLPLTRVRLYETGIGYFERGGELAADAAVSLPVPSGHLDDALKTLVVFGQDGQPTVDNLEFPSRVSPGMARALAGLPTDVEAPVDYDQVLTSMKGADLELRIGRETLRGRIVDLAGDAKARTVVLMTHDGALRNFEARQVTSVRALTPAMRTRLDAALSALSARGSDWHRALRLRIARATKLRLGYIAEAPVWRPTYRFISVDDKTQGRLQGWALVHNDTDESWRGVQVQLANGKPDSFLVPLAAPRYVRRELRTPDEELSTIPQLLEGTADGMWNDGESTVGMGGLGLSGRGSGGGGGSGYGRGAGHMSATSRTASDALTVGNLLKDAGADGVEGSTLFNYPIAAPLDLSAHASALVSFVEAKPRAQEITWFASASATARRALRLENTTTQTLPEGPISLFSDGVFIGESTLARTKPGQRQFVDFADDLDVTISAEREEKRAVVRKVELHRGALVVHRLVNRTQKYTIENRAASARVVLVGFSAVVNAKVEGVDRIDAQVNERDASSPVAVFDVAAHKRVDRTMSIAEGIAEHTPALDVTKEQLDDLLRLGDLPAAVRAKLSQAMPLVRARADRTATLAKQTTEEESLHSDLERLQKHLAALGAGKDAAQPLVARIVEHERRLEAIRKEKAKLEQTLETDAQAIDALFEGT